MGDVYGRVWQEEREGGNYVIVISKKKIKSQAVGELLRIMYFA